MSAIRRVSTAIFCVLALAACQEDGPAPSETQSAFPDLLRLQREACEKDRGRWGLAANKTCKVGSDCQGLCLARSRTCSPIEPFYGCHQVLSDSGVPQTLCIE